MTALGAATASSTDEIAGGLEKFASIADMIGLSFDYAATSLATITATTRQSEEVVGTALKTIFARIQGLKLGETLEDGTDLNKYSDSLKRVGIEIFDTSGELKDMDKILDEIGARWESLAKSEQVALAQAVAGIRQYNQLVSLMDNWDYFQENLSVARNAEGTLDEQAKIYAESWEAAQDRVKAALESIYTDLFKDEMFIDGLNAISGFLELLDAVIDRVGGLHGVLSTLGVVLTKVFSQ
jgi:TP901 family phage tail tape measure protein